MLCVKVFNAANNKPITNAKIKVSKDQGGVIGEGTTDDKGHCHFATDFDLPVKVDIEGIRDPLTRNEKAGSYSFEIKQEDKQGEYRIAIDFDNPDKTIFNAPERQKQPKHDDSTPLRIQKPPGLREHLDSVANGKGEQGKNQEIKDGQSKQDKLNDPNQPKHPENRPGGSVNHDPNDGQNARDEPTSAEGSQQSEQPSDVTSTTPPTTTPPTGK